MFSTWTSLYGGAVLVTDSKLMPSGNSVDWSQFTADPGASFSASTGYNDAVSGQLGSGNSKVVVACKDTSAAGCGWFFIRQKSNNTSPCI